jgi:glycerol-3-phosphate dehydrogenase
MLGDAESLAALGAEVLPGLYEQEIRYLIDEEWARDAEDILWRRTKLGLHLPPSASMQLAGWLTRQRPSPTAAEISV